MTNGSEIPPGAEGHREPEDVDSLLAGIKEELQSESQDSTDEPVSDPDGSTPGISFDDLYGDPPDDEPGPSDVEMYGIDRTPDAGFRPDDDGTAPPAFDFPVSEWGDEADAPAHTGDWVAETGLDEPPAGEPDPAGGLAAQSSAAADAEPPTFTIASQPEDGPGQGGDFTEDSPDAPSPEQTGGEADTGSIDGPEATNELSRWLRADEAPPVETSNDLNAGPLNPELSFGAGAEQSDLESTEEAEAPAPGFEPEEADEQADLATAEAGEAYGLDEDVTPGRPWWVYVVGLALMGLIGWAVFFLYQSLFGATGPRQAPAPAAMVSAPSAAHPSSLSSAAHAHPVGAKGAGASSGVHAPAAPSHPVTPAPTHRRAMAHASAPVPTPTTPTRAPATVTHTLHPSAYPPASPSPAASTSTAPSAGVPVAAPHVDLTPPLAGPASALPGPGAASVTNALATMGPSAPHALPAHPALSAGQLQAIVAQAVAQRTASLTKQVATLEHERGQLLADVHSQVSAQTRTLAHRVHALRLALAELRDEHRPARVAHHRHVRHRRAHHARSHHPTKPHYTLVGAVDGRAVLLNARGREMTVGVGQALAGYGHITRIGADGCLYATGGTIRTDSAVCAAPKG